MDQEQPAQAPATAEEYRVLILSFILSLTHCDHIGDVADDIGALLRRMGLEEAIGDWDDLYDLSARLVLRAGVRQTLWGTEVDPEDYERTNDDEDGDF